jgi:hypothetical protein
MGLDFPAVLKKIYQSPMGKSRFSHIKKTCILKLKVNPCYSTYSMWRELWVISLSIYSKLLVKHWKKIITAYFTKETGPMWKLSPVMLILFQSSRSFYIHTYISHFVSPKYNGHETGHDISQKNTQLNRAQLRLIVHCILQKFINCIKWIIHKI